MAYAYRYSGPTAINNRTSWGPVSTPTPIEITPKPFDRPLSANFDRIINAFERTNAFEYVRNSFEKSEKLNGDVKKVENEERRVGHGDFVVNRKMSSSYERAGGNLATQTPCSEDDDFYHEKILYSQARQLFPLQEDLAEWINKTIGITYLTGENFLDVLDNGVELCQLAAVIHEKAREALDQVLILGPVPQIKGRCWQRAARRSFFSRDNMENFITFCKELGVHENLLFESDDLVLHNQPRQVILCLLEVARLATKYNIEPPGLVELEKEIALEERDSGLDSAMSGAGWQFRDTSPLPNNDKSNTNPPSSPDPIETEVALPEHVDNESTKSEGTVDSTDSDVPLKPTNELDKRVQLVTRLMERGCRCGEGKCSKLLKVKKVGEGRYNIAGRNVFIRLLKGRHMMVRVGGGWDTLEHFLSRHEPCQVRLVTQGRRGSVVPVNLATPALSPDSTSNETRVIDVVSPASSKASLSSGKLSPINGNVSPENKTSAANGKMHEVTIRRTSTPNKQASRKSLTLPIKSLNSDTDFNKPEKTRKQSAPSYSTPNTPNSKNSKILATPKKSRSMSLASVQKEKPFCGTDRLNKYKSASLASTSNIEITKIVPKQTRSQSLASTPTEPKKAFCGTGRLNQAKKNRSMSLASPVTISANKIPSAMTQAAIEESIRLSLAASTMDNHSPNKPFLHIKAKYRSAPPREVPPR